MKKVLSLILCTLIIILAVAPASFAADVQQNFNGGKYKILVLTDTQDDAYPATNMLAFLQQAIDFAQPDLIVFTGDLVEDSRPGKLFVDSQPFVDGVVKSTQEETTANLIKAVDAVLSVFEKSGVPYALAMGNNDYKCGIDGKQWLEILSKYENCLVRDDSPDSADRLDYTIQIKNSAGNSIFNLWMMDTGRGGVNEEQIAWYKSESDRLKASNGGEILPSIVFQHIHINEIGNLFEYCNIWDDGAKIADGKAVRLNREIATGKAFYGYLPGGESEEFKAWKSQGDVLGAYFGHQHVDGFTGTYDGIELGFTYGCQMEKIGPYGFRIITIDENDVTNYENDIYVYTGKAQLGTAKITKQADVTYREPANIIERIIFPFINLFDHIVESFKNVFAC